VTVNVAGRTVIDLGARATVLDAVDRVRTAPAGDELVLAVAAGAPVLRSQIFLEVLHRAAGSRRVALVTPDVRARSLAASVHVPAFASVAALERHELDATEPLGRARKAAIVSAQPRSTSPVRLIAVLATLLAAAVVLFAVVGPSATVVVAPVSQALGPFEYDLRAGPSADIRATTLGPANISAKFAGTATGSRTEEAKAKGTERFTNLTTSEIRIPRGTVVKTQDNIQFQTTEDKTLPRTTFVIFPPSVTAGTVDIAIEAVEAGTRGNVEARRINQSPNPSQYSVENPQATAGGDSKKIPIVLLADYQLAASRADPELRAQAEAQLETWRKAARQDQAVYGVVVRSTGITPAGDVVGKELKVEQPTFELTATGTAIAYSVDASQPRAAAVDKLRSETASGYDIDPQGAVVDIVGSPSVEEDGVHWRVRARAAQFRHLDEAAIRSALAGRPLEIAEVRAVIEERGLTLKSVSTWPGWWPRLPILDTRIQVKGEAPAGAIR
jgi:hypothetical protein